MSQSLPSSQPDADRKSDSEDHIVLFLDAIVGAGRGASLLEKIRQTNKPMVVARKVAASAQFEQLYKLSRTTNISKTGTLEANLSAVGLSSADDRASFEELLERAFLPRLEKRADGFREIFNRLSHDSTEFPLIVETGCLRVPGNWAGDGQSTFLFDAFARRKGGLFYSIDINPESIDSARSVCSSFTNLILNDSVSALSAFSKLIGGRKIDLLYLDSFDVDHKNPMPSAIHHAKEFMAARPLIGSGSLICVDDYNLAGVEGGKGLVINAYMENIGAEIVYSGYQKVWRYP